MVTFTDLRLALLKLGLSHTPVIAHASLKAFGDVIGGAGTLLDAVLDSVWALVMPAFTFRTMVTPEVGPPSNGIVYGGERDQNRLAVPFTEDLPVDKHIGALAEALRRHPRARRTSHPILSFAGINAERFLAAQSIAEPLAPVRALADADGWVLLLGVDHAANSSIHGAESSAGRRQFIRWALLEDRILQCPGIPGDSSGFESIAADLEDETRQLYVGAARVRAMPIRAVFRAVMARLHADPLALLCARPECACCEAVRNSVRAPAVTA